LESRLKTAGLSDNEVVRGRRRQERGETGQDSSMSARSNGAIREIGEALRVPGGVLLISCYELGHQPLAVASPLAFLERAGYAPEAMDVAVEPFDAEKAARARFAGISVPMHTALRLGARVAERGRAVSPGRDVCFY